MLVRLLMGILKLDQIHARLAEVKYMAINSSGNGEDSLTVSAVAEAMRSFCRSVELCEDYLRGYYGLRVVCSTEPPVPNSLLSSEVKKREMSSPSFFAPPQTKILEKTNDAALILIIKHRQQSVL